MSSTAIVAGGATSGMHVIIKVKFNVKNKGSRQASLVPFSFKFNEGQLAVGLAFGFVCILAMFGLVFNASLNTRDKMKLQTTTDYATMIASNTQKLNLNEIRQQNKNIRSFR